MLKYFKIGLLMLLLEASCTKEQNWVYQVNKYSDKDKINIENKEFKLKTISVLPFVDKRLNNNTDFYLLYLMPLSPFGFQTFYMPENSSRHMNSSIWLNFNPKEDFAKALVDELNASDIFQKAHFKDDKKESDFYIRGEIWSTEYNSKLLSYGLSIFGPIFWYIGLPSTIINNNLIVKIELLDSATNKVLFSKTYSSLRNFSVNWIYKLKSDCYYSEILKDLYKEFIGDISNSKLLINQVELQK